MAISFIGQTAAAATSVTLPAHQAGDTIVLLAYRNATTAPSLPSGVTSISTQSANSNSFRLGYKIAASSSETSGTWTNASQVVAMVYRGAYPIVGGASSSTAATGTAQTVTGIATMKVTDGTSWGISFQGSKQTTSTSTPSGTTLRGSVSTDATSGTSVAFWDSNGGVSSWAAHSNTLGTTSVAVSGSFELIDPGPLVQQKSQVRTSAAATQTAVWNANTTSGNLSVVQVIYDDTSTNTISSVTDSQSNHYTKVYSVSTGAFGTLELWYAYNIVGGTTPTVTITFAGGNSFEAGILLMEFSGFGSSDPLDKSTTASNVSTSPSAGPTAATTQASELVIGSAGSNDGTNTYTSGTGFSRPAVSTVVTSDVDMGTEYKTVAATGTQTAAFTIPTSSNWAAGVATFKTGSLYTGPTNLFFQAVRP